MSRNWEHQNPKHRWKITARRGREKALDTSKVTYIVEEVGYWRKANAIHRWFVGNVQDGVDECQESYVEHGTLMELRDLCEAVLKRPADAPEILPTGEGFFFGGTEYDDWYLQGLKETIEIIDDLDENGDYYYRASW